VGSPVDLKTDGLYVQGRYGFLPRWQVALRYDVLGLTNKVSGAVNETFGRSDRWSLALTWTPSEYSRFRLQGARSDVLTTEEGEREKFNYVYLQYIISIGTHGAHRF
jgi:phosphate-selective porin